MTRFPDPIVIATTGQLIPSVCVPSGVCLRYCGPASGTHSLCCYRRQFPSPRQATWVYYYWFLFNLLKHYYPRDFDLPDYWGLFGRLDPARTCWAVYCWFCDSQAAARQASYRKAVQFNLFTVPDAWFEHWTPLLPRHLPPGHLPVTGGYLLVTDPHSRQLRLLLLVYAGHLWFIGYWRPDDCEPVIPVVIPQWLTPRLDRCYCDPRTGYLFTVIGFPRRMPDTRHATLPYLTPTTYSPIQCRTIFQLLYSQCYPNPTFPHLYCCL